MTHEPIDPTKTDDPIGEIFERAITPFGSADTLRRAVGGQTPVIRMHPDPNPGEGKPQEFEGGTIQAPVLDALRGAAIAGWGRAASFDFDSLGAQEVALAYQPVPGGGEAQLKVITRGEGGAFLLADLDQMLDDLAALAEHPAVAEAIPWADELFGSLARGIRYARDKFVEDIHAPRPGGQPSMADEFGVGKD